MVSGVEVWPPVGAVRVGVEGVYEGLAERGYVYGPVFQGLRDAWRRGDEVFVEVAVPAEARGDAARCAIHPALLDAALHGVRFGDFVTDDDQAYVPFSWTGVTLNAVGATVLCVTLSPAGRDAIALRATDTTGAPVLSARSLALRPLSAQQLDDTRGSRTDALHRVEWVDASGAVAVGGEVASRTEVVRVVSEGADVVGEAYGHVLGVLERVRAWVGDGDLAGERLVVVTRGAVDAGGGVEDVAGAAVWGLVRSAQSENPGRLVLVDTDDVEGVGGVLPGVLALGEGQVVVRS
ncbi:polyketide synthase dehydratase domain-containing protein, partial [Streptomyces malaysiensis]|uniref:polyketide synthase dehydratase domain-containing protein n=1 Tax=Streptomyces malaysiensis TaxID=92644 RepID=UPI00321FC00C